MGKIYYNGVDYSAPVISGVSGIKGNAESTYRTGNVNITPANIGLGNVNNTADSDKSVKHATTANNAWIQCLIGGCLITFYEFITGVILNVCLHMGIWDYSHMPFNILGQICLPFTLIWCVLSLIGIILDDYLRYWWFGEEKPRYKLF